MPVRAQSSPLPDGRAFIYYFKEVEKIITAVILHLMSSEMPITCSCLRNTERDGFDGPERGRAGLKEVLKGQIQAFPLWLPSASILVSCDLVIPHHPNEFLQQR